MHRLPAPVYPDVGERAEELRELLVDMRARVEQHLGDCMHDQTTDRESHGVNAGRFRISLKRALLIMTAFAVVIGGASELFRASVRKQRRDRAEAQLQLSRSLHESLVSKWRYAITRKPGKAAYYEALIRQADADLAEVERLMAEKKK